jgi:two-component system chemotaxis sensor kinase CheA
MSSPNPLDTFFHEAEDLLQQIEDIALDLCGPGATAAASADPVNPLFRAFHTIKGSSSMFGLDDIASFTHHLESALDRVRAGQLELSPALAGLVLEARDVIRDLLTAAISGTPAEPAHAAAVIASLDRLCAGETAGTPAEPAPEADAVAGWEIRFRPPRDLAQRGMDPEILLNELRDLGPLAVCGSIAAIPALEEMDPNDLYLSWQLTLRSACSLEAVKDVFIFVEDDSELNIQPLAGAAAPEAGAAPVAAVDSVVEVSREKATVERTAATVRVAADKLDRLVNLVGELVINQSRLTQAAARHNDQDLAVPVEEIERLVSELRDSVLGIRMTPIGATFNRFKRLVHDLSAELGKEIELITEGAETELDKTVLDQLGDPLVHLIRNSIDHGVETAEKRLERGKPRRGTVRLAAAHVGSNVVVSVSDDGKGIDPAALRAKAVEKQLIAADASLTESEILSLIFLPGLSTAKAITNISGRGVGMDVVKRQIEALRGTINVSSAPGQGTTIALTLPLTLAIIDGLLIQVAGDQFIVPMSVVTENVELTRADRGRNNGRNVFAVRGELIPYIDLRAHFAIGGQPPEVEKIVIVRHQDQRVGLTVDRVLGSHQTVIQSLGRFYKGTEVVSGATITGDGRVALILDIAGLVRFASRTDLAPPRAPHALTSLPAAGGEGQLGLSQ